VNKVLFENASKVKKLYKLGVIQRDIAISLLSPFEKEYNDTVVRIAKKYKKRAIKFNPLLFLS
jgi:hypothetical protein